ncbi:MAG: hypothetical protein AUJ07_05890 [Crenarchaeota archaeon 13_1_40CM_3_53_5]|nr:MAG: hypothetical protein AUJ07_05890 [Crenarchaeota archaeon 13_1_40CM_3_53_5]
MSRSLSLRPFTPGSLKALIVLEGFAILLLGSWLYVEYKYAATFRNLLNDLVFSRITLWTTAIGVSLGLIGSAAAIGLWKSQGRLRHKIETLELSLREASSETQEKPFPHVPSTSPTPPYAGNQLVTVNPQATSLAIIPNHASSS